MTPDADSRCIGLLSCPVCHEPLARGAGALRCARGHSHDIARQGYVDLLPSGHGRSRHEGDPAPMVAARRRFLGHGHYAPLAEAVAGAAASHLIEAGSLRDRPMAVLEVGCGTGYFLGRVADALTAEVAARTCLFGLDVSRPALRVAARSERRALFFVNDVRHRISVASGTVDVLIDVFAPRNAAEFARVTHRGGIVVIAIPRDGHLRELAEWIPALGIRQAKREEITRTLASDFALDGEAELDYAMELAGSELVDLILMTPNAQHVDPAAVRRLEATQGARVTAAFIVLRFVRRAASL